MQIHHSLLTAATAAWAVSSAQAKQTTFAPPRTSFALTTDPPAANANYIDGTYLGYSLDPAFWNGEQQQLSSALWVKRLSD